jgi:hypothetical protein
MKNNEIGLLIGGGLLFVGGGLLFMKGFYKHDKIKPDDYDTKTKHNEQISNKIYPNPDNPVKLDIPEDYGIGHQRADQETYHKWGGKNKGKSKNNKRKNNKRKTNKRKTKKH